MTLRGLRYSEIWSNIWRATCEASSAPWNLGTNSAFALGPSKTTGNLNRVGRSQDLPEANRLLASSTSFNTRNLTSVSIWLLLYFKNKTYVYLYLQIFLFICIFWMSTKQLCITSAKRTHAYTYIIFLIIWVLVNLNIYCDGRGIGCYTRFVAHPVTED
jgi:hypothetical protein